MKNVFTVDAKKGGARRGTLATRAGAIKTPVFMPVGTRGAVKGLHPCEVKNTGAQIILGNTYHLHLQPGEDTIKNLGGLHDFTRWDGPILTDSGGFQVFSLAHIRKITEEGVTFKDPRNGDLISLTPEKAMRIQLDLGGDIIMAFDDVVSLDEAGKKRTEEAVQRTHRWLERCVTEFKRLTKDMQDSERPLLFGIAQGGLNRELRAKSIEFVQSCDVDGVAIGGLSVGETREEMHDMLEYLAPLYDPDKAHYLMGVGDPIDFRFAIEHGIDMVDCVMATRNARHGTAWIHKPCTCTNKTGKAGLSGASRAISDSSSLRGSRTVREVPLARTSQKNFATSTECKTCGGGDKKINLNNQQFTEDATVIDPECDCTTCKVPHHTCLNGAELRSATPVASSTSSLVRSSTTSQMPEPPGITEQSSSGHCFRCGEALTGFSRGFLRHQFKVNESLAGSLVSIHNIRYLNRIAEQYYALR
ncbi:MAG: tRNA guanosine(34) transglycosylase Tgt [Candidatus Saccharibacteria bacterium]|nr:tRNA guanosine(34) transglycosylase Tgt [Candidatus Saccharibacteria bacterium]